MQMIHNWHETVELSDHWNPYHCLVARLVQSLTTIQPANGIVRGNASAVRTAFPTSLIWSVKVWGQGLTRYVRNDISVVVYHQMFFLFFLIMKNTWENDDESLQ